MTVRNSMIQTKQAVSSATVFALLLSFGLELRAMEQPDLRAMEQPEKTPIDFSKKEEASTPKTGFFSRFKGLLPSRPDFAGTKKQARAMIIDHLPFCCIKANEERAQESLQRRLEELEKQSQNINSSFKAASVAKKMAAFTKDAASIKYGDAKVKFVDAEGYKSFASMTQKEQEQVWNLYQREINQPAEGVEAAEGFEDVRKAPKKVVTSFGGSSKYEFDKESLESVKLYEQITQLNSSIDNALQEQLVNWHNGRLAFLPATGSQLKTAVAVPAITAVLTRWASTGKNPVQQAKELYARVRGLKAAKTTAAEVA